MCIFTGDIDVLRSTREGFLLLLEAVEAGSFGRPRLKKKNQSQSRLGHRVESAAAAVVSIPPGENESRSQLSSLKFPQVESDNIF